MLDGVIVRRAAGVAGLYAARPYAASAVVLTLDGIVQGYPARFSIQVGATEHLMPPLRAVAGGDLEDYYRWCFMNHACAPTARVDPDARSVIALRGLAPGDEVTFDYETTEWNMAEPFDCFCGAPSCRHRIRGFKHLTDARRAALATPAAAFLYGLLQDWRATQTGPAEAD